MLKVSPIFEKDSNARNTQMAQTISNWLLNDKVRVATGATKNATGHWKSHCWQARMRGYHLVFTPGYVYATFAFGEFVLPHKQELQMKRATYLTQFK